MAIDRHYNLVHSAMSVFLYWVQGGSGRCIRPVSIDRLTMILRLTLLINLLILGVPSEATLKAETPAKACKSTVTGTLEIDSS